MTEVENQFAGRTRYIRRPAWQVAEFRSATSAELRAAQVDWDVAESAREQADAEEVAKFAKLTADETFEEPASKALENRLRVAFLGTRGATMQGWAQQRDSILAGRSVEPGDQATRGGERRTS